MKRIADMYFEKKLSNKRKAQGDMPKQMLVEMLEEAQEHLYQALETVTKVASTTGDVHAETYIVRHLSELIEAENPYNFSITEWIEQLEEGDEEEETEETKITSARKVKYVDLPEGFRDWLRKEVMGYNEFMDEAMVAFTDKMSGEVARLAHQYIEEVGEIGIGSKEGESEINKLKKMFNILD